MRDEAVVAEAVRVDPVGRTAEVVVGVDGTETALRAVAWAAEEAVLRRVPLTILHATPYRTDPATRGRAAAILGRAYTVARRAEPAVTAHSVRSDAPETRALVEASRGAALLVVGRLSGHPGDAMVPSVAPAVVAAAHCPVTVVRTGTGAPADRRNAPLVLGVEDVERDAPAIGIAFADAHRHAGPLLVRHVGRHGDDRHAAAALLHAIGPWRTWYPDVAVQVQAGHGSAASDLVGHSVTARMVVVGNRGRHAATAVVMGSTVRALLQHSGCPVTVVPHDADPGPADRPSPRVGGPGDRRTT